MKISVSGKFASGKSTFCKFLSRGKTSVLSGDEIGKELFVENKTEILALLKIRSSDNYIQEMSKEFIKDEAKFIKYNNWMYLHLPEEIINRCSKYDDVILDATLIFEWQIDEYFDLNILITDGDFEERFKRVSEQKEKPNKDLYRMLDKYQWNDSRKKIYSDLHIENNENIENLKAKADEVFDKIFNIH